MVAAVARRYSQTNRSCSCVENKNQREEEEDDDNDDEDDEKDDDDDEKDEKLDIFLFKLEIRAVNITFSSVS